MYIDLCYVQPAVRAQMTVQQVMHDIVKLRKPIVDTTVIIPSSGVVNGKGGGTRGARGAFAPPNS